ncbi:hypothetical protein BKG91_03475 [Rodentibacter caecimuris]|uniref:Uncharacterized protein n=1 Tax=Rodentibacter caecimuris TaxID=1796644 RepID=A0A9X8W126_9PAST|nr:MULTISPECIES: DUF2846 domain-containing protein [Pasteurellaceae]OOF70022.1 hypothetical protein BKG90_11100 [Rodentibacter heylii]OOF75391.1 hypothetical protein BKG91_03475 [Rodentibacter heylii]OOF76246.1 hypothetical protein BKG99_06535 [Rodentibacter heylii]TGY51028.1 DUF2846 domain-containing protein [Pasteurella caecimuris]
MKKLILSILVGILLTGCSTTPITENTGKQVPKERVYDLTLTTPAKNTAKVVILRDSGFTGSGCSHDIFVDKTKAVSLKQGEYANLYVSYGEHVLRLKSGAGLCPNIEDTDSFTAKENQTLKYRS